LNHFCSGGDSEWKGYTYRSNDALSDLTLEAQIGLAKLGALVAKFSNLCALWEMASWE
jgi:hypothetical protein